MKTEFNLLSTDTKQGGVIHMAFTLRTDKQTEKNISNLSVEWESDNKSNVVRKSLEIAKNLVENKEIFTAEQLKKLYGEDKYEVKVVEKES